MILLLWADLQVWNWWLPWLLHSPAPSARGAGRAWHCALRPVAIPSGSLQQFLALQQGGWEGLHGPPQTLLQRLTKGGQVSLPHPLYPLSTIFCIPVLASRVLT